MKIGDLAELTGVPPRMLRYYEQQGLLEPRRSPNGYRDYTVADVDRVEMIRYLIQSGLPTRLVRSVLLMESETWTTTCTRELAAELATELTALEKRIGCLRQSRDTVRRYLEQTEHADLVER